MVTKSVKCREHNGTFRIEVRRGRPPVKCTENNPCDVVAVNVKAMQARNARVSKLERERVASAIKSRKVATVKVPSSDGVPDFHSMTNTELKAYAREHFSSITRVKNREALIDAMERQLSKRRKAVAELVDSNMSAEEISEEAITKARARRSPVQSSVEKVAAVRSVNNRSVEVAQAARAELEAVGWAAKGRGWTDGEDVYAELTATRGSETIVLTWCNGHLTGQDYSMWHSKPSRNAMPKRRLKFNPDEMTDGELIRSIAGMKVTWWNSLAKSEESFTVGTKTLSIEHTFAANGDEDSARRVVKFVDMNGGGFRHFHVDALLKVG